MNLKQVQYNWVQHRIPCWHECAILAWDFFISYDTVRTTTLHKAANRTKNKEKSRYSLDKSTESFASVGACNVMGPIHNFADGRLSSNLGDRCALCFRFVSVICDLDFFPRGFVFGSLRVPSLLLFSVFPGSLLGRFGGFGFLDFCSQAHAGPVKLGPTDPYHVLFDRCGRLIV